MLGMGPWSEGKGKKLWAFMWICMQGRSMNSQCPSQYAEILEIACIIIWYSDTAAFHVTE